MHLLKHQNESYFKFSSQKNIMYKKITIENLEKEIKYTLPDSNIKGNSGSNFVIIHLQQLKDLGLKIKLTNNFIFHCPNIFLCNNKSIKLKS